MNLYFCDICELRYTTEVNITIKDFQRLFLRRFCAMMSQDSLQLALTTGFGFSILAGIFSGVVYILSVGYNNTKRVDKPDTPWHCKFCGKQFKSINGVLEIENVVTCMKCARTFCREKCAKRPRTKIPSPEVTSQSSQDDSRRSSYSVTEKWICKKCQPDSWISGIVRLLQFNETKDWYAKKMTTEQAQINAELTALQRKEREQVRDFMERLVEALLGGGLDAVSVKKIYNDDRYDRICARYHGALSKALTDLGSALHVTISNLPIAGETPCAAHSSLKTLIQRFIREATGLPELRKSEENNSNPRKEEEINDRTYEDLLSTAIINKVVQNYQDRSPSVASTSKASDKEYFLGEQNLETPKFEDTSSTSSLDEYINTNGSTKYLDQMNFAIQQSIREVSSSDEEQGNYDIDEIDSAPTRNNDWQENWYLRKRKFASGTNSPVPVPMLVPNPNQTENAKVLIGDREVDDTSDLSDAQSDYADSAEPSSLNAVLINSKNVIGGRNPLVSMVAKAESNIDDVGDEAEIEQTNVILHHASKSDAESDLLDFTSSTNEGEDEESEIIETCNLAFVRKPIEDLGTSADVEDQLISLESNTEKDLEYTERYATLPRKIPMPTSRQSKLEDIDFSKNTLLIEDSKMDNADSGVTSDEDDKQKSFKGSSYGEREKDKWNHAVDLPNNPYSKSNLESRLSNRSNHSSISSLNSLVAPLPVCEAQTEIPEHTELVEQAQHTSIVSSSDLINAKTPTSPKSAYEMSKSLFDVLNEDRKGYQHRYGRDYWAKAAAKPHGAMKKSWLDDDDHPRNGNIADDEERKIEIVDDPIVPEENIYRAVPAKIKLDDSEDTKTSCNAVEKYQADEQSSFEANPPTKRLQPWDLSSDSDYSIERTYNVNSGKIIKKLGDIEYELPVTEVPSAEGLRYTMLDENENDISRNAPKLNAVQKERDQFLRSLTFEDDKAEQSNELLESITPPAVNHFKIVNEIANESGDQYNIEPISPPAEYKNLKKPVEQSSSIEYESEEKSYDFSIDSTFEDEERAKALENMKLVDVIKESILNREIIESTVESLIDVYPNDRHEGIIVEETINKDFINPSIPQTIERIRDKTEISEETFVDSIREPVNAQNLPPTPESLPSMSHIEITDLEEGDQIDGISKNELDDGHDYKLDASNLQNKLHRCDSGVKEKFHTLIRQPSAHSDVVTPEPEISDLKEKHLVKNLLGAFSKSFPSLATSGCNNNSQEQTNMLLPEDKDMFSLSSDFIANSIEIEEASPKQVPSVHNLMKKFEQDSDVKKDVEVHSSLTARSVPKQMRQQLAEEKNGVEKPRRQSMLSECSVESQADHKTIEDIAVTSPIESVEVDFPMARSRIAFFEQMSKK